MKLKFNGAVRAVTGSAHLITLDDGFRILLDCGLFQGGRSDIRKLNKNWLFNPESVDSVILSHAHIDHTGRVPKLVKDGFMGTIHSTHATRGLCAIMLLDSAKIQESDAAYYNRNLERKKNKKKAGKKFRKPLYTTDDVAPAMSMFVTHSYNKWFKVHKNVEVYYTDAGHILGSASITLRIKQGKEKIMLGFTGDIGRPDRPILRDPQLMPPCDYLISESTYGDKNHESTPEQSDELLSIIEDVCVKNKGRLIIPAFSVGRTQEIVYMLDKLETAGKLPKLPIYVDSPLAVNATTVFGSHPECFDDNLSEYMLVDPNPFGFNDLKYIRDVNESKALNNDRKPSIIISSSGMMNAGRVKHHLRNNIEDPKAMILIVGYCAPNTPGGQLRKGAKEIKLFGDLLQVNASIKIMDSFSAHAGQDEMIDFLSNHKNKLKKLFLVHGDYDTQKIFKYKLIGKGFKKVEIPDIGFEYNI